VTSLEDQIRRYLDAIPSAISGNGGHTQTFSVACALIHGFALPRSDARGFMEEYSRRCDPVWSEREIEHKLTQAETCQTHQKPRGHLLSKSVRHVFKDSPQPVYSFTPTAKAPTPKAKRYEPRADEDLPKVMVDGARELLRAAFEPGEGVCICIARNGDDGREVPKDEGVVLSREEWLAKLDKSKGDPNGVLSNTARNGIYIRMNPMRLGGSKDSDVTAFRYALIESDSISEIEQWRHIAGSGAPVMAVIQSGKKSVHAWVRVDAKDRREYDERVKLLHAHFAGNGFEIDSKNKNPSRFSRLPNCVRGKSRQELLALKIGAESFGAWHSELECDSIGRVSTIKELRKFIPANDPNTLLGDRWICRRGSCLFVGQSGIGKSSLAVQAAITWALGREFFGIKPARQLKSVFIQAENDDGDLAEMCQGVLNGLQIDAGSDSETVVDKNVIFVSDSSHTGEEFCANVQRLIDRHRPDLVWLDPLLSFIGDDISKQAVCSQFLRTWLGPISESSGVAWMMMHHTGKPSNDPKARQSWNKSDHSYAGIGSSELTNWARAVCVLERLDDNNFSLRLAKRGKRAGALDLEGIKTERIWLQHASEGIQWKQAAEPPPPPKKERSNRKYGVSKDTAERDDKHKAPGRPGILDELRPHLDEFLGMWAIDESLSFNGAAEKLVEFAKKTEIKIGRSKAIEVIRQMVDEAKLTENKTANGSLISI
jgi:RecA-family ATPase